MEYKFKVKIKPETPKNAINVIEMFLDMWWERDFPHQVSVTRNESQGITYDIACEDRDAFMMKIRGVPVELKKHVTIE